MNPPTLDRTFAALSNPMRREILSRLGSGEATVTEIAAPFQTSLNAVSKHLKVLEEAGLIARQIRGREHYCRLNIEPLDEIEAWIQEQRRFWQTTLDALEQHLIEQKRQHDDD